MIEETVEKFLGILEKSSDLEIARTVMVALANLGKEAAPILIKSALNSKGRVGDHSSERRAACLGALELMGEDASEEITRMLDSANGKNEAIAAIEFVGKAGMNCAIPRLINMLAHEDTEVKTSAFWALWGMKPGKASDLRLLFEARKKAGRDFAVEKDGFFADPTKPEKCDVLRLQDLYSKWSGILYARAETLVADKKFHIPEIKNPDGTDRVLRVRRVHA